MRTNATILNIGGGEIILIAVLLVFLGICALGFFGIIYLIIRAVVNRPAQPPPSLPQEIVIQNQQRRDREHLRLLSIFHFVFAGLALLGIGFVFVHYFIMHPIFSMVIGGLNCLQIPFGTALGIFTIMVLSRDSVRELYSDNGRVN